MNDLHRALRAIRKCAMYHKDDLDGFDGLHPFHRCIGICSNVGNWLKDNVQDVEDRLKARRQLLPLIRQWEADHHLDGKRQTCAVYPVAGFGEYKYGDIWRNPRRWQLLSWLLHRTA